jgi:hypothetical protein
MAEPNFRFRCYRTPMPWISGAPLPTPCYHADVIPIPTLSLHYSTRRFQGNKASLRLAEVSPQL